MGVATYLSLSKRRREVGGVVLFSAHLSIAIKRLTIKIQAKSSFG